MQVAGRAGRRDTPGEVLIQTDFPFHTVYQAVCRQDYAAFAQIALEERRAVGFPPYAHQVLLRAEAATRGAVDRFLEHSAALGRNLSFRVEVYNPVPAPVARIAGRERGHLLVQSTSREELQRFLDAWQPQLSQAHMGRVRWALDVDPLDL